MRAFEYLIFLIGIIIFGLSILIDVFQYRIESYIGQWRIFLEDGFKFVGIVGWFGYLGRCCFIKIKTNMDEMKAKAH